MQLTRFRVVILLVLAITSSSLTVWHFVAAGPSPSIGRVVTPGNIGDCTYFVSKDGTTPVAEAEISIGGLSPGDNVVGTAGQDMATFLSPLVTNLNTGGVFCFSPAEYDFKSQLLIKAHGVYFVYQGYERIKGDQSIAAPSPSPVYFKAAQALGTMITWGNLTLNTSYNEGGMIGIDLDCNNLANFGIEDINTHSLRLWNNIIENCPTYGFHAVSNLAGGISNLQIRYNLFRNTIVGMTTGRCLFFDSKVGQSWIDHDYFSKCYDYAILLSTGSQNNNFIEDNYIETTTNGSDSAFKGGTAVYVVDGLDTIMGNQMVQQQDYFCLYLGANPNSQFMIIGNICTNPNNASNPDGACWYVENTPSNINMGNNNCLDARAPGSRKMVYGLYINTANGAQNMTFNDNVIWGWTTAAIKLGASVNFTTLTINRVINFNPVGKVTNAFITSGTTFLVLFAGTSSAPQAAHDYICAVTDCIITSTGGAPTITIKDNLGNTVFTAATLSGYYMPQGYKVNWSTLTSVTVTAFFD